MNVGFSESQFERRCRLTGVRFEIDGFTEQDVFPLAYNKYMSYSSVIDDISRYRMEDRNIYFKNLLETCLYGIKATNSLENASIDVLILFSLNMLMYYYKNEDLNTKNMNRKNHDMVFSSIIRSYSDNHELYDLSRSVEVLRGPIRSLGRELVKLSCEEISNESLTSSICHSILKLYLDNRYFIGVPEKHISNATLLKVLNYLESNSNEDVNTSRCMLIVTKLLLCSSSSSSPDVVRICERYVLQKYNSGVISNSRCIMSITNYLQSLIDISSLPIIENEEMIVILKSRLIGLCKEDVSMIGPEDGVVLFKLLMELNVFDEDVVMIIDTLLNNNIINGFESLDPIKSKLPFIRFLSYYMILLHESSLTDVESVFYKYERYFKNVINKTDHVTYTILYQSLNIFRSILKEPTLEVFGVLYDYNEYDDNEVVSSNMKLRRNVLFDNNDDQNPHALLSNTLNKMIDNNEYEIVNEFQLSASRVCDIAIVDKRSGFLKLVIEFDGRSHRNYQNQSTLITSVRNKLYSKYYDVPLVVVNNLNTRYEKQYYGKNKYNKKYVNVENTCSIILDQLNNFTGADNLLNM